MQADSRVGKQRALQNLAGEDESPRSNPILYTMHFRYKLDTEKKVNPCAIENSFTQEIGSELASLRSNNESEFVIENSYEKIEQKPCY